ncbi:hypothetical protein Afil01_48050 [Actinorhabdospora filicis]|uniref:Uncharacterized protein n=1 Tax=Actinorhabdospora filicis TaxID=1785913 RepID=A0A9W6SPI7_9ACTN|nr:hypothetical protein Afil01_48050 [Actinorhabdospora filicis]
MQATEIVARSGSVRARENAKIVIDEARKALYRLLAELDEEEGSAPEAPQAPQASEDSGDGPGA